MDKKIMVVLVVVVAVAVIAVAAFMLLGNKDTTDYSGTDESSVRLTIYGNANGDDVIDKTDIAILEKIIKDNGDSDASNDIDWKKEYAFADADQDGKITKSDVTAVQNFIDKKSQRMYYKSYFGDAKYVNFPIGDKIASEYCGVELLIATGVYDKWTAVTTDFQYGEDFYPGVSSKSTAIGGWREITMETLADSYDKGICDVLVQWTGGQNTDYLWEDMVKSGMVEKVDLVAVPVQGPTCINGVLMFANMMGKPELAEPYVKWYGQAENLFNEIGKTITKKTVTVTRAYNDKQANIAAFGAKQGPALWFNKIVNFQDEYKDATNFVVLGFENWAATATDEVIAMLQQGSHDPDTYNKYIEDRFKALFSESNQYKNQKIYATTFNYQAFFAGPAMCYLLAADLYPDHFDKEEAYAFLQTWLDDFSPLENADAHYGFVYSGSGYN
jgi:hypothetical protein